MSQSTVSRLETGHRAPIVKEVTALCKAYRASAEVRTALKGIARPCTLGTPSTSTTPTQ
jgi:hypothetical protein